MGPTALAVDGLVDHLFRRASGRIVAGLTRALGPAHIDLAEDCAQVAFRRALETWPYRGVPASPEGWLLTTARNAALDRIRRNIVLERKLREQWTRVSRQRDERPADTGGPLGNLDDEAAMVLMCCHPVLAPESRIALTLKTVGGLSVAEIARALLAEVSAVAQRLVRAKRLIRERGIRFEPLTPADLQERLPSALDVLYLIFNEGYSAHAGENQVRADLCSEALRLVEILASHPASRGPEVHALAALMLLQISRLRARTDRDGALVLLADQDRSLWDHASIERGLGHLRRAAAGDRVSSFHLEAGIAACHAASRSFEETPWPRIRSLYDELVVANPSPVVRVNRAVAIAMVDGPAAAIEELRAIEAHPGLAGYALLPATLGELWERLGQADQAAASYRRALQLALTQPERHFLERKLLRLQGLAHAPGQAS